MLNGVMLYNVQRGQKYELRFLKSEKVEKYKNENLVMKECSKKFQIEISPKNIFSIEIKKKKDRDTAKKHNWASCLLCMGGLIR